ncbi:MAG TPA: hypothetical protein VF519_13145 [Mycobacteriales bacterium]
MGEERAAGTRLLVAGFAATAAGLALLAVAAAVALPDPLVGAALAAVAAGLLAFLAGAWRRARATGAGLGRTAWRSLAATLRMLADLF